MTRITWAPQAIEDVEAIRAYVARDSSHYADLVVERIVAAVARLESHPLSGRVVPEVGDEALREVIHGNWRPPVSTRLSDDSGASNFTMNPPASLRSAGAGYRARSAARCRFSREAVR